MFKQILSSKIEDFSKPRCFLFVNKKLEIKNKQIEIYQVLPKLVVKLLKDILKIEKINKGLEIFEKSNYQIFVQGIKVNE